MLLKSQVPLTLFVIQIGQSRKMQALDGIVQKAAYCPKVAANNSVLLSSPSPLIPKVALFRWG